MTTKTPLLLLFVLFLNCSFGWAQQAADSLVGIWQNMPVIASGWSENFQFFSDGSFRYNHNQMNCQDSVISESGTYSISEEGLLVLQYTQQDVISGGQLIPATRSCGSEYELIDGTLTRLPLHTTKKLRLSIIHWDNDFDGLQLRYIGGQPYWRMNTNPDEY